MKIKDHEKLELAYWAGFFDGEGTISINRRLIKNNYKNPSHCLYISISNTNKEIVLEFLKFFGVGQIHTYERHHKSKKWKTVWRGDIWSREGYTIIKQLYPFLRVKKRHCNIALNFQENKRCYNHRMGLSKKEVVFRQNLYHQLKKLNCRGKIIGEI